MASPEKVFSPVDDNTVGKVHQPGAEGYTADIKETIKNVDHDDAADLFAGTEDVFEYTAKEATWVRWKLDLILLSMVLYNQIYPENNAKTDTWEHR